MSETTGHFVWYELMVNDRAKAEAFYTDVVGWTAADAGMSGGEYTIFSVDGAPVAGLMGMPPQSVAAGARPGWRGYISVENTDAMAARVAGAGGVLRYGPEDIPGVGRVASMTDPQGAPILLMTPAPGQPNPRPAAGTPGTIGWHELPAADGPSAFEFYAGHFGWTAGMAIDMKEMGKYQIFEIDNVGLGGILTRFYPAQPVQWIYYINTAGIDAAIERVKAAGGQVLIGPQEVPGGSWILQGTDPTGVQFAMVAPVR
jgi:predicted enzyme related to lactoylglutathione lyase